MLATTRSWWIQSVVCYQDLSSKYGWWLRCVVTEFKVLRAIRTWLQSMVGGSVVWWIQSVVCYQDLTSKYGLCCICYSLFNTLLWGHWVADMGTLLWLNAERVLLPLFGRLVRCSAHVYSNIIKAQEPQTVRRTFTQIKFDTLCFNPYYILSLVPTMYKSRRASGQ